VADMQEILMRDVTWLPVVEFKTQWALANKMKGLAWFPDNQPRFCFATFSAGSRSALCNCLGW
jgi:hypothetical protein